MEFNASKIQLFSEGIRSFLESISEQNSLIKTKKHNTLAVDTYEERLKYRLGSREQLASSHLKKHNGTSMKLRKRTTENSLLIISGDNVGWVGDFCFLGLQIEEVLTWSMNTAAVGRFQGANNLIHRLLAVLLFVLF